MCSHVLPGKRAVGRVHRSDSLEPAIFLRLSSNLTIFCSSEIMFLLQVIPKFISLLERRKKWYVSILG